MKYSIENLGIAGYGSANDDWASGSFAIRPETGEEIIIHSTLEFGIVWIDVKSGRSAHLVPEDPLVTLTSRGATQGRDGRLYLAGCRVDPKANQRVWHVLVWDWKSPGLRVVAPCPSGGDYYHRPAAAPDGAMIYGGFAGVPAQRFDPVAKSFTRFADASEGVYIGLDGQAYSRNGGKIEQIDARTGTRTAVHMTDGSECPDGEIVSDADGRVIVIPNSRQANTVVKWIELRGGRGEFVDPAKTRISRTIVGNNELAMSYDMAKMLPYVLSDGTYISRIVSKEVTVVAPTGETRTFTMQRHDRPQRLFSIERCDDRLFVGGVLPLYLMSFDPASERFTNYGNPSPALGEIYNMVASRGRLYFAAYPGAYLVRYDPNLPWRLDRSEQANPKQLGPMKDVGLHVHRVHGRAIDPSDNVYFAAYGDYGCEDSAVVRIDANTEAVSRWIYPNTRLMSLVYLSRTQQLLASETRGDEKTIRFTFICPDTGKEISSEPVIHDHGMVTSWLHDGGDWVYGLHDYRATIFAYSLREKRIVTTLPEIGMGEHLKNSLVFGKDGKIWGLTDRCVFAVDRDLKTKERLADYEDCTNTYAAFHSRFGASIGPDGHLYFINGPCLMRMRTS
ncbi:MAG: hypothetical protein IT444_10510 [Phycisphaeraceae bacterium]|nr:hypothetical protein [Phycisphaeraceae bacterium]